MATVTLHLTLKNLLSVVIGVCVVSLALIPLLVPTDHLGWRRWQVAVIASAGIAVAALICQAFRQSREDNELKETLQNVLKRLPAEKVANIPEVISANGLESPDWGNLSQRFKDFSSKPLPIYAEWIENLETRNYDWWVRGLSDVSTKLCIEICKEAGRKLLAIPSFSKDFPGVSAVTDDGDRWLLAINKIAKIGKVEANLRSSEPGKITEAQGGRIADLPGASQVLCHMAINNFRQ